MTRIAAKHDKSAATRSCVAANVRALATLIVALVTAGASGLGLAMPFTFTRLAASSEGYSSLLAPVLTDNGVAYWYGRRNDLPGTYHSAVFKGSAAACCDVVIDEAGEFDLIGSGAINPGANASGQVAFAAKKDDGTYGIFRTDGTTTQTIFSATNQSFNLGQHSINSTGTVVYRSTVSGSQGIYTSNGTSTATIYDTSDFQVFAGDPVILDSGAVAFAAFPFSNGSGIGWLLGSGGSTTPLLGTGGDIQGVDSYASVNDAGTLAARVTSSADPTRRVVTADGTTMGLVAGNGVNGIRDFRQASINGLNRVAFVIDYDDESDALAIGSPGDGFEIILRTGDTLLDDMVVNEIELSRFSLNDAGQFAFLVQGMVQGGTQRWIVLSDSASAPEPGSLALLGVGVLAFGWSKRKGI